MAIAINGTVNAKSERFKFIVPIDVPYERAVQYTRTESGRLRYASTRLAGSPMARDLENKRITRVMS